MNVLLAYLRAAWDFFRDPAIDLNTDFAPEFPSEPRNFQVFVFLHGHLRYDVQFRDCHSSPQEIELLFIDAGFPASSIDVTEVRT